MATKNRTKVDDNDNEDEMGPNAETAIADRGTILPDLTPIINRRRWTPLVPGSSITNRAKTYIYRTPTDEIIKISFLDREPEKNVRREQEMLVWIAEGIEKNTNDKFNFFSAGAHIPGFDDIVNRKFIFVDRKAMVTPQENCNVTLLEKIKNMKAPASEKLARTIWKQLVEALAWLHEQGRAHRDLKGENICIMRSGRIKLIDFGHAINFFRTDANDEDAATKVPPRLHRRKTADVGTEMYQAPELKTRNDENDKETATAYDPRKVDVWAAGCTLVTMVVQAMPFHVDTLPAVRDVSIDQTGVQRAIAMLRKIDSGFVDNIVQNHTHPLLQAVYFKFNNKFKSNPEARSALRLLDMSVEEPKARYALYVAVLVGDWDMYWNIMGVAISSDLKALVAKLLDPNPATRPTFADILQNDAWTQNGDVYTRRDAVNCLIRGNERPGESTTRSLRSSASSRSLKRSRGMLVPSKPFQLPDGVESIDENDLIESHIMLPYSCDIAERWTSALKAVEILGRDLYGTGSFRFLVGGPAHADCFNALMSFTVKDDPVVVRVRCVSMKSDRKLCAILFRRVYGPILEFCSFIAKAEEAITGEKGPLCMAEEADNDGFLRSLSAGRLLCRAMSSSTDAASRSLRSSS